MVSGNGKPTPASNAQILSEMKKSDSPIASEKPGMPPVTTTWPELTIKAMTIQSTELLATMLKTQNAATSLKPQLSKELRTASQSGSAVPKRSMISINSCGCLRRVLPAKTHQALNSKESNAFHLFQPKSVVLQPKRESPLLMMLSRESHIQ